MASDMASDEAVQLSLDYLNSKRVHDKLVNAINDNNISEILDLVQDGYTQGRADALRWRKYPEEKPKHDTRCAVYYQSALIIDSNSSQLRDNFEFYDWRDDCETCLELWNHVERFIELPTEAK